MMNKTIKTMIVSGLFLCTISATAQEEFNEMRPPFPQQEEGKAPFKEVPNPEKSAKRITEEMSKELGLTEKQYKKVYKVILKEQKTLVENSFGQNRPPMMPGGPEAGGRPMMGNPGERPPMGMGPGGGMPSQRPPRMDEDQAEVLEKARKTKEKKLKKILSDEQYTQWQEMQQRNMKPGKAPVPPEKQ